MEEKRIPKRYRNDVPSIIAKWGSLTDGKVIETTLTEIFGVVEREYRKVLSYKGLVNYLKRAYGVELKIASNKNKKVSP